jgi:hypothetical protein
VQEFLRALSEQLQEHWIKFLTAAGFMAVGWFFGKRKAKAEWAKKEFFDRVNVSLNTIHDGKLYIRTVIEKNCADVFLNAVAVETINAAARMTNEQNAMIPLEKGDYWYYLNAVLNEVAEKFATGTLKRDMHLDVKVERYLICLTSECAGDMRTRKIRAMLVKKSLLQKLPEEMPQFESPRHSTRWETLKQLAVQYQLEPDKFLDVEICV